MRDDASRLELPIYNKYNDFARHTRRSLWYLNLHSSLVYNVSVLFVFMRIAQNNDFATLKNAPRSLSRSLLD